LRARRSKNYHKSYQELDHENIFTASFPELAKRACGSARIARRALAGYDGEWTHVTQQLMALAEATPEEKFSWRPAAGVRSTSEVYMHIAVSNFYLLSVTGPKMPAELDDDDVEKKIISKPEVIAWLKRSLDAVKIAHTAAKPKDLKRKVKIFDRDATVDGIYLRIIVHANEHMGQLVAYARMTGVVPPWSK